MMNFGHRHHIPEDDFDDAAAILDQDRKTAQKEKQYDDERQKLAISAMSQTLNSIALVSSTAISITVHTAQQFVSYLFIYLAVIFIATIAKNTLYVYKEEVSKRLGTNVYTIAFQYLSISGSFFFYLLFTLVRSYFEITQSSIPFIVVAFGFYTAYVNIWNLDTQTREIIRIN